MQLLQLPPGFRFHPTDEELIMFYLRSQVTSTPCPASIISEIDIYKFDPWELPEKAAEFVEKEWYFYSRRERKYPNGARPNRAAVSGYWKATGTDKPIYSKGCVVGVKKGLVFYKGKPPKGVKTDWIMHEFRLLNNGPIKLDDWVLCRIYRKRHVAAGTNYVNVEEEEEEMEISCNTSQLQLDESASAAKKDDDDEEMLKIPRNTSFSHLLELDYCMGMGSISHLFSDNSYNPASDFQAIMGDNNSC